MLAGSVAYRKCRAWCGNLLFQVKAGSSVEAGIHVGAQLGDHALWVAEHRAVRCGDLLHVHLVVLRLCPHTARASSPESRITIQMLAVRARLTLRLDMARCTND
jgi:hypothetical protein